MPVAAFVAELGFEATGLAALDFVGEVFGAIAVETSALAAVFAVGAAGLEEEALGTTAFAVSGFGASVGFDRVAEVDGLPAGEPADGDCVTVFEAIGAIGCVAAVVLVGATGSAAAVEDKAVAGDFAAASVARASLPVTLFVPEGFAGKTLFGGGQRGSDRPKTRMGREKTRRRIPEGTAFSGVEG